MVVVPLILEIFKLPQGCIHVTTMIGSSSVKMPSFWLLSFKKKRTSCSGPRKALLFSFLLLWLWLVPNTQCFWESCCFCFTAVVYTILLLLWDERMYHCCCLMLCNLFMPDLHCDSNKKQAVERNKLGFGVELLYVALLDMTTTQVISHYDQFNNTIAAEAKQEQKGNETGYVFPFLKAVNSERK